MVHVRKCPCEYGRGRPTIEFYRNGKPMIYCMGWIDKMTDEPLPICKNCKDWYMGMQCEEDFSERREPMNDLISRQAAIDAIMGEPTDAHYPSWYAERLEQLPPAEPKTGEWVLKEHLWECDQCGCRINRANPLKWNVWNYNFCPNCGARMKGGAE